MSTIVRKRVDLKAPFLASNEITIVWDELEKYFYYFEKDDGEGEFTYFVQPTGHAFPWKASECELVASVDVRGTVFHLIRVK